MAADVHAMPRHAPKLVDTRVQLRGERRLVGGDVLVKELAQDQGAQRRRQRVLQQALEEHHARRLVARRPRELLVELLVARQVVLLPVAVEHAEDVADRQAEVGHAREHEVDLVDVEHLPVEDCAHRREEAALHARIIEQGKDEAEVVDVPVVERQQAGVARQVPAVVHPALADGLDQLLCGDHRVVPPDVPELLAKEREVESLDLPEARARQLADIVVHHDGHRGGGGLDGLRAHASGGRGGRGDERAHVTASVSAGAPPRSGRGLASANASTIDSACAQSSGVSMSTLRPSSRRYPTTRRP